MSAAPAVTRPLDEAFQALKAGFASDPDPGWPVRRDRLKALRSALLTNKDAFCEAVSADFGNRARMETLGAEVMVSSQGIAYMLEHAREWMASEPRHIGILFAPAWGEVRFQPKGVVGVISPWNYPVQLAFVPLATALAAGNRVLLKPSELTPRTSELMAKVLHETFAPDVVRVVTGDASVGASFSALPFDHLFFTGSTAVGRAVMRAAAENLTPVTLELGGKSPAIVHAEADLNGAAERIAFGKLLNAGQTCVAPDTLLVPRPLEADLKERLVARMRSFYPTIRDNGDYTSIVTDRHHARLTGLVQDARDRGAVVTEVNPAGEDLSGTRKIAPTLIQQATDDMAVMQEEIFGPILPIVPYDRLEDAIAWVNARPRPLALYYFDTNRGRIDRVLRHTHSGGVTINDTALHVGQEDLPFGGIGPSGMGAYHGKEGFQAFSHAKAVMHQRRVRTIGLFNPPFGRTADRIMKLLVG